MTFNKTKWGALTAAFCFAILQALQPFIHAHLDIDHPIQHTGFHVSDEHEEYLAGSHDQSNHAISVVPHASHTFSVAPGIKQDIDPALVLDIIRFALVCFCLAIALQSITQRFSHFRPSPYQSLRQRLPASRAPPQY